MLAIAGIVLVIAAIAGGYLMEHGQLIVLVQPAELLIILGSAIGTMLIAKSDRNHYEAAERYRRCVRGRYPR